MARWGWKQTIVSENLKSNPFVSFTIFSYEQAIKPFRARSLIKTQVQALQAHSVLSLDWRWLLETSMASQYLSGLHHLLWPAWEDLKGKVLLLIF